jgi:hypothetical protein
MNDCAEQKYRLDPGNLEERSAVRFSLSLPVQLIASDKFYEATTENISANGILFKLNEVIEPGTEVNFLIHVQTGTESDPETAAIHCLGRVVRTYLLGNQPHAAAVIDEYRFQNEENATNEE